MGGLMVGVGEQGWGGVGWATWGNNGQWAVLGGMGPLWPERSTGAGIAMK